jgi:hypothetical protein
MKRLCWHIILGAALVLVSETPALACAACFGASDSSMARSLNASIFTLMGVLGTVLAGAASFFVFLAKKAAAANQAEKAKTPSSQLQA